MLLYRNSFSASKRVMSECLLVPFTFRGGSRAAITSKMQCFVIIVNGSKPLTIITKHSILDVAAALDPPLALFDQIVRFVASNLRQQCEHASCFKLKLIYTPFSKNLYFLAETWYVLIFNSIPRLRFFFNQSYFRKPVRVIF